MAGESSCLRGATRAIHFAAVVVVVLLPVSGRTQGNLQAEFRPLIAYTPTAHSGPARLATEDESALGARGYAKIGTIRAVAPEANDRRDLARQLEAAVLSEAANAGGDLVRLERADVPGSTLVKTGKMKRICTESESKTQTVITRGRACWQTGAESAQCTLTPQFAYELSMSSQTVKNCKAWKEIPELKDVRSRISEGTVWTHDPELAARTASNVGTKATLYVYRESSIVGRVRTPAVLCDDVEMAFTQSGRYFRVYLEPGVHYVRGEGEDLYTEVHAQPGFPDYLAAAVNFSPGLSHANGYVWSDSADHAIRIIQTLKALDADKIVDRTRVAGAGELRDRPSAKDLQ